jgi:flagellar biosynthetic protein FlhB
MSQERSEAPTQRRLEELRERGQAPRSAELQGALALVAGFYVLRTFGPGSGAALVGALRASFGRLTTADLTASELGAFGADVALLGLRALAPLFVTLPLVGLVAGLGQTGLLVSPRLLAPDLNRVNPLQGLRRLFSLHGLVELAKSLLKVVIVGFVAWQTLRGRLAELPGLAGRDVASQAASILAATVETGLTVSTALLALAAADYAYQRWDFWRNARMTKQEVKEELRQSEGSPETRSRLRQRMRRLAQRRMMHRVPKADVVVTNPVHLAVALEYDARVAPAPRVTAKGAGAVAERIKAVAREHGVPVVENRPLAQALYRSVEVGMEVPVQLYAAVAEVLAYIYALRRRRA